MKTKTTKAKAAKTTAKKKPAKAAKAKASTKTAKPRRQGDGSSKREICAALLLKGGVTGKQLLEATGWPAISVPAVAKASGLKLTKEKVDGKTLYSATQA